MSRKIIRKLKNVKKNLKYINLNIVLKKKIILKIKKKLKNFKKN